MGAFVCVCVYLVSVGSSEGDPAGILYIITDQGVATGVLQGLLDVGWLVSDHINHQLGSAQLPQLLICGLHLGGKHKSNS